MKLFEIEQELESEIIHNCSNIFEIYQRTSPNFLYHGLSKGKRPFDKIIKPREGRKPTDTPEIIQEIIDDMLYMDGFKALRSNSIFTTTEKEQAVDYGKPFIAFPINGFNYTWFKNTHDLYGYLRNNTHFDIKDLHNIDELEEEKTKIIQDALSKVEPVNKDLEKILKPGVIREVMIDSPCYLLTDEEVKEIGLL